ncbi:MAG: heme lyase CcmF/NrfE family subunit [Rickettsiaceae bacterium]|nr:heme lyase CcmF/NrfE family subunit [Rickettsiaceae bacterium]
MLLVQEARDSRILDKIYLFTEIARKWAMSFLRPPCRSHLELESRRSNIDPNHNHLPWMTAFTTVNRYATITAISLSCAFILLIIAFIISDFSIRNVFTASSTIMPLSFRISAAWSSHEGSLLMWLWMMSLIGTFSLAGIARKIYASVILFFASFIYFSANPFDSLSINPTQGLGLNPILQDAALMIHPPILYLGYSFYLVPFVYCILALLDSQNAQEYFKKCRIFSALGCFFLISGISLGSWWAYRELGWGGYWFFDPVENISLIPLIGGIAFHHSLLYSIKDQYLTKWTIFYGINIFPITIFGAFLVRSGLLTSVHSFSSASNAEMLLIFSLGLFASSNMLFFRTKTTPKESPSPNKPAKQALHIGNLLWLFSLIIILFSLITPIIASLMGININIEAGFFKSTLIPITVPITILASLFPYFSLRKSIVIASFSAISSFYLCYIEKIDDILLATLIFASNMLIYAMIFKAIDQRGHINKKSARILTGHLALGLLSLSITLNVAGQKEIDFIGRVGDAIQQDDIKINLQNIYFSEEDNYYKQIAEFTFKKGAKTIILKPENRLYKIEQSLTSESYIISNITEDIYCVLNQVNGDIIHAKIYIRPFMKMIWLSLSIIALAFFRIKQL